MRRGWSASTGLNTEFVAASTCPVSSVDCPIPDSREPEHSFRLRDVGAKAETLQPATMVFKSDGSAVLAS